MTAAPASETPQTPAGTPRTSWLQLGVISASEFVVWAGFGAILPYLPLFLQEQAHASMTLWAVIAAMYYVGTLLFSSPLGWLSDTIGRKPVMIGGAVVYTVALLLFTTTTDPHWFILFRLLEGVGAAAFGPAAQAFIADITTSENRSRAYGFLTTAQFGGLIVGPAVAAPLYALGGGGTPGFYAVFYFGAALSALALVALIIFIKEPAALRTRRAQRRSEEQAGGGRKAGRPPYRAIFTAPIIAFVVI
ncbi:MAG TPA: MFS transporter, partial [Dehalococcoidia bacterium]|nr:MFS transporter [Dehalococcoidia bacterium]